MSFWGMFIASIIQLGFLFFFIMGTIFGGCAKGSPLQRQDPRKENFLGLLFLGGVHSGFLALGMLTYGYWWGQGSHYYYFMLPPWGFAIWLFSYRYHYEKSMKPINAERWQRQWREILELTTEEQMDFYYDYELHSALWAASEDKQAACFAVLPYVEVIYERVQQLNQYETDPSTISDEALLAKLEQQEAAMLNVLEHCRGSKAGAAFMRNVPECSSREVYRGTRKTLKSLRNDSVNLESDFRYLHHGIISKYAGVDGEDVFWFVRRVLSCYKNVVATEIEWVLWGIVADQFEYDPYLPALALERLGAKPLWQSNGARIVFVHESEDESEGKAVA